MNAPERFKKLLTDYVRIFVFVNDSNVGQDNLITACLEQLKSAQEANIL